MAHQQPDEEMHRARSGTGASVPVELGCVLVHQPESSPNPILWGFYGGFIM